MTSPRSTTTSPIEIGFGTLQNNVFSDGAELGRAKQVTLMIDEGAIFKLKESHHVGSTTSREMSAPVQFRCWEHRIST